MSLLMVEVMFRIYYIRNNYMFRHLTMVILRLRNEKNLVEERKTNLMSLAILFHFLCAQLDSDINISIIRSL